MKHFTLKKNGDVWKVLERGIFKYDEWANAYKSKQAALKAVADYMNTVSFIIKIEE